MRKAAAAFALLLCLSGCAPVRHAVHGLDAARVVFVGDSYTWGVGASDRSRSFPDLVAKHEHWDHWTIVAVPGSGYITARPDCGVAECLSYLQLIRRIAAQRPTLVVVSGGRNDLGQPATSVTAGVAAFYRALRKAIPSAQIVATSPIWGPQQPPQALGMLARDVRLGVEASGGKYVALGSPLLGRVNDVAEDQIHPNDAGHALIAQALERGLKKLTTPSSSR